MHGRDRDGEIVHGGLFVRQPHQANRIIWEWWDNSPGSPVRFKWPSQTRECWGRGEWELPAGSCPSFRAQHSLCTGKLGELGVVTAIFQSEIVSFFLRGPLNFASNISPWNWAYLQQRIFLSLLSCHSPSVMHSSSENNPSQRNQHKTQPSSTGSTGRKRI